MATRVILAVIIAFGLSAGPAAADFAVERAALVAEVDAMYGGHVSATNLETMSPRVRAAMSKVERHKFVPPERAGLAYRNHPLPIGLGQTISQPYIVALSTDLVGPKPGDTVLEIGTGSGYQAAVLAEIVARVYTIEIIEALGREAAARLEKLGYANVEVRIGDGYKGWPEKAPFDAIVVTAAAPRVPDALVAQLKPGGRMVIPVGPSGGIQDLMLIVKTASGNVERKSVIPVRFVPMVPGN